MKPYVRCATTPDGEIEAVIVGAPQFKMIVDRVSGAVIRSSAHEGTDEFRWMVRAAREHVAR